MKAIVRDDIIGLESYVDAEFKYKKYIEVIAECGGYCFIEQVERLWKSEGGRYLVQKMEDANLVKTHYFSKYKYLVLTPNALKYLYYRDDERDFSDIPKNKIPIKNIKPKPSDKVLFTSVLNFEHSQFGENNKFLLKKDHLEMLENSLKINNDLKIKKLDTDLSNLKEEYFKHKFAMERQEPIYIKLEESNKELNNKIKILDNEKLLLEEKSSFIKNNNNKIESIEEIINHLKEIISVNSYCLKSIDLTRKEMNDIAIKHNSKEKEIEQLYIEQREKNKLADEIIDKLITIRDVSKTICLIQNNKMFLVSTFVKYHKLNYLEIIRDIISTCSKKGIEITTVELNIISIFEPPKRMNLALKKIEDNYNGTLIDFKWKHILSKKLDKYFDTVQDSIGYVKEDHVEQFAKLKDKLSKK